MLERQFTLDVRFMEKTPGHIGEILFMDKARSRYQLFHTLNLRDAWKSQKSVPSGPAGFRHSEAEGEMCQRQAYTRHTRCSPGKCMADTNTVKGRPRASLGRPEEGEGTGIWR